MSVVQFIFGNQLVLPFTALIAYLLVPRMVASGKIKTGRALAVISLIGFVLIGVKALLFMFVAWSTDSFLWNGLSLGVACWMSYQIYHMYIVRLFR